MTAVLREITEKRAEGSLESEKDGAKEGLLRTIRQRNVIQLTCNKVWKVRDIKIAGSAWRRHQDLQHERKTV